MYCIDVQLREILERSAKVNKRAAACRAVAAQALSAAACFVLLLAAAFTIPLVNGKMATLKAGAYGSLILFTPKLSYAVIAVLGFLLGVCVTLLCVRLWRQGREDGQDR